MSLKLKVKWGMHMFGKTQLQGSSTLTYASGVPHRQAHLTGMPVTSVMICAASGHERRSRTTGIVLPVYLAGSANTTGAPNEYVSGAQRMHILCQALQHTGLPRAEKQSIPQMQHLRPPSPADAWLQCQGSSRVRHLMHSQVSARAIALGVGHLQHCHQCRPRRGCPAAYCPGCPTRRACRLAGAGTATLSQSRPCISRSAGQSKARRTP